MASKFKKTFLFFCFFLMTMASKVSLSQDNFCDLSGIWEDTNEENPIRWILEQHGGVITGRLDSDYDLLCGYFSVSGKIDSSGFVFKAAYDNSTSEWCGGGVEAQGLFTSSTCQLVQGTYRHDGEYYDSFTWNRDSKIHIVVETNPNNILIISKTPKMPELTVRAQISPFLNGEVIQDLIWDVDIQHHLPSQRILKDDLPTIVTHESSYHPDFNLLPGIRGGDLYVSVKTTAGNFSLSDTAHLKVKGSNPDKELIDQAFPDPALRHIACQESSYRQFNTKRESEWGVPLIGKAADGQSGGIGIMQLYIPPPSDEAVWNWKKNMLEGGAVLNEKLKNASRMHIRERHRLNQERQKLGLSLCPANIPLPLTSEQQKREAIRRYNCGREYRWEPRDAQNCEGHWVDKPTLCNGSDVDYVEKVLDCN